MQITVIGSKGINEASPADLKKLLTSRKDLIWLDFAGVSDAEVKVMEQVFQFHPLTIEDTRNHRQQPKIEEYPDYLFAILNSIAVVEDELAAREVDIFVGHNYVITVHEPDDAVVDEVSRRLLRSGAHSPMTSGYLFYMLIDAIVDGYFPVLDNLNEQIEALEDRVLVDPRQEMLNQIFVVKRMLIDLWRVVWPEREMINILSHQSPAFISHDELQPYLRDAIDHLLWIADMVNTLRDTATSLMDLYMSSVSNRLNRVVNRLTVITVVIGLMTVIGGFYGMNFERTWPPFSAPWGVPLVMIIMLVVGIGVWVYFRWKEWV